MNLLSIGASYGILTAIFQLGWLSGVIGLSGSVTIVSYVPLFMFEILFRNWHSGTTWAGAGLGGLVQRRG